MIGHEGVRRLTEAMLRTELPKRLKVIRAAVPPVPVDNSPADWPPDPHVFCADVIPDRSDWYPAVMVNSAKLTDMSATEAGDAGVAFLCTYEFDVAVAVVAAQAGGEVLASVGRDRILLALRETLILHSEIGKHVWLTVRGLTEETGPIAEDISARPMSAGVISLSAKAIEAVDDHTWPLRRLDVGLEVRPPVPTRSHSDAFTSQGGSQPPPFEETLTAGKTKGTP